MKAYPVAERTVIIRCLNWEDEPEICGETCGVLVTRDEKDSIDWVDRVLEDSPHWLIMLRSCPEHHRHIDAYCSLTCFTRRHSRHPHPQ